MRLLIAGGGTGGHLFPGVALVEELLHRSSSNKVMFVGTRRGIEARVIPELGYPIEYIDVQGLKGKGLVSRLQGFFKLPLSLVQSFSILRKFKPNVVVGVGGYASGPMILAAWLSRIPTVVLEQNTVPGITNRLAARFASRVVAMFEESKSYFPGARVEVLGNPIRRSLLESFQRPFEQPQDKFRVLVLGGSQGARMLNTRMGEAALSLKEQIPNLQICHQTGKNDEEAVRKVYQEVGVDAEVLPFIKDMSGAYLSANLIVCRAGATTLAEVGVAHRPAILVPFPYATDNHQEKNGAAMVAAGAAEMIIESDLTAEKLASSIVRLAKDPDKLQQMQQATAQFGRPEAAQVIVDSCARLAGLQV